MRSVIAVRFLYATLEYDLYSSKYCTGLLDGFGLRHEGFLVFYGSRECVFGYCPVDKHLAM